MHHTATGTTTTVTTAPAAASISPPTTHEPVDSSKSNILRISSLTNAPTPSLTDKMSLSARAPDLDPSLPQQPSRDNCDRRRPEEDDDSRLVKMPSDLIGKTVTPYLKEHIPGHYAPIGKNRSGDENALVAAPPRQKDPSSRYCYRHRPDSKCRRAADETKMGFIQRELSSLPTKDQEAVTHVWALFSAAPAKHRELMLQGIITQCCFPQLSTVSREVHEQLKIDFLTALPAELGYKILCYLDTVSLCKAAQVSRRWRNLADDDVVWHRMCTQHISRQCRSCGWGLPLLERKKLMAWNRRQETVAPRVTEVTDEQEAESDTVSGDSNKRSRSSSEEDVSSKRPRLGPSSSSQLEVERKFRPWKDVYRDRFKVGYNWKTGRCSIRTFSGHENGVTCLQFDDNILATGSYDTTIRIWNIDTGNCIRVLRGHTNPVRALQFDGSKLISGSFDKTIKIWNLETGECVSTLQGHTDGVVSVHFDGLTLASGSIDQTVKIWSFDTKQMFSLHGHTDWVNHVRIDTPSRTCFSASDDLTVKLWDLDTKRCIKTFTGHVGQVQQLLLMPLSFEPDGIAGLDNTDNSSVHSGRGSTPIQSPEGDLRAGYGPSFTSDPERPLPPQYMLTGGLDNTIRLWDTSSGRCLRSMFGHVEGIWGLAGDTLRVVSSANDAMVKIWEPRSGKCERSFTGHAGPVTCVGLSDSRMASGSEDGEVFLYSFEGEAVEERGTPS